jgi:putative spermidine/putrescine transport system substrate-binding protein
MLRIIGSFLIGIALITGSVHADTTITVCTYGGTYTEGLEKIFAKPFTDKTGIKVVFTAAPSYAKMQAQVKSGNIEWDIVEPTNTMYARGIKEGIFELIDLSMIPREEFVKDGVLDYGVGIIVMSYNVAYRTDKWPIGKGPKNMKDFWDTKRFPGPRTLRHTPFFVLESALIADGVPKDQIYPLDIDRALKKLNEIKPFISVFWKTGGNSQQVMREGEADVGLVPGGRLLQLVDQGVPVTMSWEDQLVLMDYWSILKGSKKKDAAMKFIAFMADAKRQGEFAEWSNYGPVNKKAYNYISKEKAMKMPTYPENLAKGVWLNGDWYAEHGEELEPRWAAWKME